jgi:putative ABC transport system permease protein
MKNPLNKRLIKELKSEAGKYIALFVFIAGLIAIVSGFLVASDSMLTAYHEGFDKYIVEDGNFELAKEADSKLIDTLEKEDLTIYENYYKEEHTKEVDSTLRIYENRSQVDLTCLMEGKIPENENEIAIDRMYADNNKLSVGDRLTIDGKDFTISALVALSDYSALFSNNSDTMFDAVKFGVAVVSKDGFKRFGDTHLHYNYSWRYDRRPVDENQEKEWSDSFVKTLAKNAMVVNYIPGYQNQALHFAGDDFGKDRSIFTAFLYIVVIIIAFVFAITTSNTISRESSVIGALRASGYKRAEMIRHYMAMPMLVILIAALVGNILGYSFFKKFMADLYYGTYSLPTYVTRWNADAFVKTTVVPLLIMFVINLVLLINKLHLSPLKFLRHDLSRRQKKKAFKLNTKIRIFTRFRLRIIFQNMPNYITLFIGILFANFILLFGLMFGPLLDKYQADINNSLICDYQYILKAPVETKAKNAEKFCVGALKTIEKSENSDEITVYGIEPESSYIDISLDNKVYISDGYADKYKLKVGDQITLKDEYEDTKYTFDIQGIYDYPSTLAVFMSRDAFNDKFDQDKEYFNGYFSNQKISDINAKYIATTITEDDLSKVSRQLDLSMGDMMLLFVWFSVIMFILLMYLLSKLIIEKNAQSISMVKILGYNNGEIGRLYIMSTTIVVMASIAISIPLCNFGMGSIFSWIMADFTGWLPYYVKPFIFVEMALLGIFSYVIVAILQMNKIKKIPKSDALKNVE